ncbi:hypothetical protein KFE98_14990 [bacterium SCSIO 12741]|nr:hypothetical protein KFE98_14990 [bacterium SCSIO 12741]
MKHLLTYLILLTSFSLSSQSVYDRLVELNAQWVNHPNPLLQNESDRAWSERELIQFHLIQVVVKLRTDTTSRTEEQQIRRRQLLDQLEQYAQRGQFPNNDQHPDLRQPYFVGSNGNACAVGQLMLESNQHEAVKQIVAANNFAYVSEIAPDFYKNWMNESGFTPEELAWIQPTYHFDIYRDIVSPRCGKAYQLEGHQPALQKGDTATSFRAPWYEGECKNGVLDGKWRQWHSTYQSQEPKIWVEGQFKNGKKSGTWTRYRVDGGMADRLAFKEGQRHGLMQRFDQLGRESYHLNFVHGKPDGFGYLKYDSVYLQEVYYDHGKPVGHWKMRDHNNYLWLQIKFDEAGVKFYQIINTSGDLFTITRKNGKYYAKLNQVEDKGWEGQVVLENLPQVPVSGYPHEQDDGIWTYPQWGFQGSFRRHGKWTNSLQNEKQLIRYYRRDTLLASVEIDLTTKGKNEKWTEWFPKSQMHHPQYFSLTASPRGQRMKTVVTYSHKKREGYLFQYYPKGHIRAYEHIRDGELVGWRMGKNAEQEYPTIFCEEVIGDYERFKISEYGSRDSMTNSMRKSAADMKVIHQSMTRQVGYDPADYSYSAIKSRYGTVQP